LLDKVVKLISIILKESNGDLIVADGGNHVIRQIIQDGHVTAIAVKRYSWQGKTS